MLYKKLYILNNLIKKLLAIVILGLFFSQNAYSHSGNTGPTGCHMDYSTANYHCHNAKQSNPFATYYYIKYQGRTYGPYSSYNTCMQAIRGANISGAYCSTSQY